MVVVDEENDTRGENRSISVSAFVDEENDARGENHSVPMSAFMQLPGGVIYINGLFIIQHMYLRQR